MPVLLRFSGAALAAVVILGCSAQNVPPGALSITVGKETDTWTGDPAPTQVVVDKQLSDGTRTTLSSGAPPLDRVDLGNGAPGWYEITGTDAGGTARVRGRSIELDPAGLAGLVVPLFVGRADAFSRPPGDLLTARGNNLPAAIVAAHHLLVAGSATSGGFNIDGYDFGAWAPHGVYAPISCPAASCTVRSLAVVDVTLAVVIGDDWAESIDTSSGAQTTEALPDGLDNFGEIAGGRTIVAGDGSAYIVGATRATPATSAVLRISSTGVPTVLRLGTPRAGAAATWIAGRGLLVVGGSTDGAGAELVADGAPAFASVPYPADATTGAALIATDADTALRLGGRDAKGDAAPTVSLAIGCTSSCTLQPAAPDVALDDAQAFAFDSGDIAVVGTANGQTGAFHLAPGATSAEPVPLREPRIGATALLAPTGQLALVGGTHPDGTPATSIELYLP